MYGSMQYLSSMVPKPNYKQIINDQSSSCWLCIKKRRRKKKRELGIGCNDKVGLHVLSLALITPDLEQRIKTRCRPLLSFVTLKS